MKYVCIGKIVNTHGIKGELKIQSYSDFDRERYKKGAKVFVLFEGQYLEMTCNGCRIQKGFTYTSFEGMPDINLVEKYKGSEVYIAEEARRKLGKGEYYRSDLLSLEAVDEQGKHIGTIAGVEETNSRQNHLRIVKDDGTEILIPYVPAFIANVSLEEKKVTIRVIEGLL